MEEIDYKEIAKRHLEIMNREFNLDQIETENRYSFKSQEERLVQEEITRKNQQEIMKIPYYFNFNNTLPPEDKINIITHYLIPGTNSKYYCNYIFRSYQINHLHR